MKISWGFLFLSYFRLPVIFTNKILVANSKNFFIFPLRWQQKWLIQLTSAGFVHLRIYSSK